MNLENVKEKILEVLHLVGGLSRHVTWGKGKWWFQADGLHVVISAKIHFDFNDRIDYAEFRAHLHLDTAVNPWQLRIVDVMQMHFPEEE